ncbi:MAG: amylo-alpha-1,6-glucosidase [Methanolobus sp.]|uniref:amylo-alpha-1,6-glucosidase n=1 Tax=Methanolobus sp. TaxID=1874737 RepID=UPI0027317802|nr:amylo-alpha-1,6-glucosidase [Methanolobus sp.]MDP2217081.1 amylo-alpha-1,6-glucosidase [Methanolobus sp.]
MDTTDKGPWLRKGTEREWIITNGLGGYASSTVTGMNTRKYHGLLVASLNPPINRRVLLSSLDEEIQVNGKTHKLAVHQYPGTVYPEGYRYLHDFSPEPFPACQYLAENIALRKTIMMVHGENTTVIRYDISNPHSRSAALRIFPLVNNRNIHGLTKSGDIEFEQNPQKTGTFIRAGQSTLELHSDMAFIPEAWWYYNLEYKEERSRGYPHQEDNFNPGYFEADIGKGNSSFFISASAAVTEHLDIESVEDVDQLFESELQRRNKLIPDPGQDGIFLNRLAAAADSFIVSRQSTGSKSIIAGYHWFADWGRDAMIAMPGLTLVTGRFDVARDILTTFASSCAKGLIPNLFPDDPAQPPVYNTVDASLWFIHALGKYLDYTGDLDYVRTMWDTIENIIGYYSKGTKYDIRMEEDGLISQGGQLTWMDAKVWSREVTPRKGKACEINALWYNTLMHASSLGDQLGMETSGFLETAELAKSSFEEKFWNEDRSCLYDYIPGPDNSGSSGQTDQKDVSVRPNQILAVSLPFTMLSAKLEKSILNVVREELLTPYGLRTLSPSDPGYIGTYRGNTESRDMAYHNGTVWPWLLGPYITAYMKVNGHSKKSRMEMMVLLEPLKEHLAEAGIGTISEVFDGDAPHIPGGCISQAWSVAEILRACVEDIGAGNPGTIL